MFFDKNRGARAEWLVVGLGNPGEKYENTRHNVGFLTVDELAERARVPVQKLKHRALTNTLEVGGVKVLLMKPVTYMNLSGEAVGEAARFYKLPPERVLVISDDVSLPVGKLRIRKGGSAGGHNGLKSIIQHLGTDQFPRIKVGVGQKPHPDYDMADWVLSKFAGEDLKTITEAIRKAADAVECLIQEGPDKAVPPEHLESHRAHYILAEVPEEPVSVGQAQRLMLVVLVLVAGPMEAAGMLSEVLLRLIREVAEVAEVALGILKCLEVLVAQESFY